MTIKQLQSIDDFHEFVQQAGKHLLLKHSTTCPISAKAHEEFLEFIDENPTSAAIVHVIEDRPVSNQVAEEFGIKHESPQIFLIENGEVRWNTSHWKIKKAAIKEALGHE